MKKWKNLIFIHEKFKKKYILYQNNVFFVYCILHLHFFLKFLIFLRNLWKKKRKFREIFVKKLKISIFKHKKFQKNVYFIQNNVFFSKLHITSSLFFKNSYFFLNFKNFAKIFCKQNKIDWFRKSCPKTSMFQRFNVSNWKLESSYKL